MKNSSKSALPARVWTVLMLAGAVAAIEPVSAATNSNAPGVAEVGANPLHATLESKKRLVKLLLAQSPAVQRIPHSDNAPAKKKLADAKALYAKAETESNAGRAEMAIQLLDESLRQIVSASTLVPDVAQQAAQERRRNTNLREAIRTFQALHENFSGRMSTGKIQNYAGSADIGRIDAMLDRADALIVGDNQHEANVLLNNAYTIVVSALNKMLTAETIVYDLKFDSQAEEFQHELARNRSYEELIPIALAQWSTAPETATLAERHAQQSRALRDVAQMQAGGGDYQSAVKTIQEATSHLQRSLSIAGVVVPQSPEIMP